MVFPVFLLIISSFSILDFYLALPGKKKDALVNGHVEKVQAITLQRQRDRQRQMEQIQVAREIQVSKDAEALQKFRRTFYAKGTSISKPRESPPMGLGNIQKRTFRLTCHSITHLQIVTRESLKGRKFNSVLLQISQQKMLWINSRQRWIECWSVGISSSRQIFQVWRKFSSPIKKSKGSWAT